MRFIVEKSLSELYKLIENNLSGETKGSCNLKDEAALIVKEKYSFMNGNQMSISIMLHKVEKKTEMVVVTSGSSRGVIFKFDWGSGDAYSKEVLNILTSNDISFYRN